MAGKIFINYRRGDDPQAAGRLFDRLEDVFGREQLFMDVDNIEPGLDFVRVLNEQVALCDVLISVIGRNWIDARNETGARRLDNPDDFVRIEIESALAQGKRVIPVLVGQAPMPRADELPEPMKPLARRNAVRLTHERFRADTEALIAALHRALKNAEEARAAQRQAEVEHQRQEVEAKRRAEEEAQRSAAEEEQLKRQAEAEQSREKETEAERRKEEDAQRRHQAKADWKAESEREQAEAQRLRDEVAVKRRLEEEERWRQRHTEPHPFWPPSHSVLVGASLIGVALFAVGAVWFLSAPAGTALTASQERALRPKDTFKDCAGCPQMLVVPAGSFTMGSPESEPGRSGDEGRTHPVTIAKQFAVAQYELTFDEWDACVAEGGCKDYDYQAGDQGWGRGRRPVTDVSWDAAKAYVAWLSRKTGKTYRLLSEAEYEYAARAGTTTAYPWGNDIGRNNANCRGCGSQWDGKQTAPVGSFAPNRFGLHDMVGNVLEWTEDCYHDNYSGAPTDGSPWTSGYCIKGNRVLRGGSWYDEPEHLRSASRDSNKPDSRSYFFGFRVARTLLINL